MSDLVVDTRSLTKDYGAGRGLFDLTLAVPQGASLGLLGPNGAGKTTTIRLLMGLARPTRGAALVLGRDALAASAELKRFIGHVPGELPQLGGLRGAEVVAWIAGLRGDMEPERVRRLTERLDLDLGRRWREYSHGNKQKLLVLLAFAHRARLLILDEPTRGLDPLAQRTFHELVDEERAEGTTVILASHVLSEVEQLCDRIAIIRDGRLLALAPLEQLHALRIRDVEVEFAGAPPRELLARVALEHPVWRGRRFSCTVRGDIGPLLRALAQTEVVDVVSREPSLEEVFLAAYGRRPAS